jgi:DNA (cytosine-5)-methyltransferase 1
MEKLRVLDLFSGLAGFSLGLERTGGFETVAFCEVDPFCQEVIRHNYPGAPIYADVRLLFGERGAADVICGGFPCQPYSTASAGKRKGAEDDRALWPEMLRLVSEIRPGWVVGENVAGIDGMDLERVVSDLEAIGYEVAPPLEIPACAVGQDHWRARVWIIGHTDEDGQSIGPVDGEAPRLRYRGSLPERLGKTHGVSAAMGAFGNAVHPGIVEFIGRAILEARA